MYVRADNTTSAIRALQAELDKLPEKESTSIAYSSTTKIYIFCMDFVSIIDHRDFDLR